MVRDLGFEKTFLVIQSWQSIQRYPNYEEVLGCIIYQRLFKEFPRVKTLFGFPIETDVNSNMLRNNKRFLSQARFLMEMLDQSLGLLGPDIDLLTSIFRGLGRRHEKYGVEPEMYPIMGEALVHALKQQLGNRFTSETEDAWKSVYHELTYDMIHYTEQEK